MQAQAEDVEVALALEDGPAGLQAQVEMLENSVRTSLALAQVRAPVVASSMHMDRLAAYASTGGRFGSDIVATQPATAG